jgi:hypothetical protein
MCVLYTVLNYINIVAFCRTELRQYQVFVQVGASLVRYIHRRVVPSRELGSPLPACPKISDGLIQV